MANEINYLQQRERFSGHRQNVRPNVYYTSNQEGPNERRRGSHQTRPFDMDDSLGVRGESNSSYSPRAVPYDEESDSYSKLAVLSPRLERESSARDSSQRLHQETLRSEGFAHNEGFSSEVPGLPQGLTTERVKEKGFIRNKDYGDDRSYRRTRNNKSFLIEEMFDRFPEGPVREREQTPINDQMRYHSPSRSRMTTSPEVMRHIANEPLWEPREFLQKPLVEDEPLLNDMNVKLDELNDITREIYYLAENFQSSQGNIGEYFKEFERKLLSAFAASYITTLIRIGSLNNNNESLTILSNISEHLQTNSITSDTIKLLLTSGLSQVRDEMNENNKEAFKLLYEKLSDQFKGLYELVVPKEKGQENLETIKGEIISSSNKDKENLQRQLSNLIKDNNRHILETVRSQKGSIEEVSTNLLKKVGNELDILKEEIISIQGQNLRQELAIISNMVKSPSSSNKQIIENIRDEIALLKEEILNSQPDFSEKIIDILNAKLETFKESKSAEVPQKMDLGEIIERIDKLETKLTTNLSSSIISQEPIFGEINERINQLENKIFEKYQNLELEQNKKFDILIQKIDELSINNSGNRYRTKGKQESESVSPTKTTIIRSPSRVIPTKSVSSPPRSAIVRSPPQIRLPHRKGGPRAQNSTATVSVSEADILARISDD